MDDGTTRVQQTGGEILCEVPGDAGDGGFTPDGRHWYTWSYSAGLSVYNLSGERLLRTDCLEPLAFSPDGQRFVTPSEDCYEIRSVSGAFLRKTRPVLGEKRTLVASPHSDYFAAVPDTGKVVVFDFDGEVVSTFDPGSERRELLFHPRENLILTAGGGWSEGRASLRNLKGEVLTEYRGLSESILAVRFSKSGNHVLGRSWGGEARLWKLDGICTAVMDVENSDVTRTEFTPEGKFVITMHRDGAVRTWNVSSEAVIQLAQERITRGWYPSEAERFKQLLGTTLRIEDDPEKRLRDWYPDGNITFMRH